MQMKDQHTADLSGPEQSSATSLPSPPPSPPSMTARRRSLFWRIHFWAALIASPFALLAALTGMLYVFTPQIEGVLYRSLDHVAPAARMRSLDQLVEASWIGAPDGWTVRSVVPPYTAGDSLRVSFSPFSTSATRRSDKTVVVYVNPYTTQMLGSLADADRFGSWAKELHSRLQQGDGWRWMIELAASWLMVMLVTGIALWWPHGQQKALPQSGASGRIKWKQWHGFIGVLLGLMTATVLSTGLTWSKYAGDQVRALRDHIGQTPPQVPRSLHSTAMQGAAPISWQAAWDRARAMAPDVRMQLTPPSTEHGVWRVSAADSSRPTKRFDLVLDGYSAATLYYADWRKQTVFAQATAIGIPFHRGEFGWWNQALLLAFAAGIVFSIVSGWIMVFKRRGGGALSLHQMLPRLLPRLLPGAWKSCSPLAWVTAALMCAAMPLLAVSAALLIALECGFALVQKPSTSIARR